MTITLEAATLCFAGTPSVLPVRRQCGSLSRIHRSPMRTLAASRSKGTDMTAERDPAPMGPTDQPPSMPPAAPDDEKRDDELVVDDETGEPLAPGVPD
jgi:hypothetical protein